MTTNLVEILTSPTYLLYSLPPRDAGLCLAATPILLLASVLLYNF